MLFKEKNKEIRDTQHPPNGASFVWPPLDEINKPFLVENEINQNYFEASNRTEITCILGHFTTFS